MGKFLGARRAELRCFRGRREDTGLHPPCTAPCVSYGAGTPDFQTGPVRKKEAGGIPPAGQEQVRVSVALPAIRILGGRRKGGADGIGAGRRGNGVAVAVEE